MSENVNITALARLREIVATMEASLGIDSLSANELDVLYAVRLLADAKSTTGIASADIRDHPIARRLSQPTYNRTIRLLLEKGYLVKSQDHKAKFYSLGPLASSI